MNQNSQSSLSGPQPKKLFPFNKESTATKKDIYSSTQESIKEESSIGKSNNMLRKHQHQKNQGLMFKKPRETRLSPKNVQSSFLSKKSINHSEKVITSRKCQNGVQKSMGNTPTNTEYYETSNKNSSNSSKIAKQVCQSPRECEKKVLINKIGGSPNKNTNPECGLRKVKSSKWSQAVEQKKTEVKQSDIKKSSPAGNKKNTSSDNKSSSWYPSNKNSSALKNSEQIRKQKSRNSPPASNIKSQRVQIKKKTINKPHQFQIQKNIVQNMQSPHKSGNIIPKDKQTVKFFRAPQIGMGVKKEMQDKKTDRLGYQSSSPVNKGQKMKSFQKTEAQNQPLKKKQSNRSPPMANPHKSFQKKSQLSKQSVLTPKMDTKRSSGKTINTNRSNVNPTQFSANKNLTQEANRNKLQKITLLKLCDNICKPASLILMDKITEHSNTTIYRCIDPETNFIYCLKKCKVNDKNINLLINEHKISICLNHPNLVRSYCTLYDKHNLYLLMEYMQGGILLPKQIIRQKSKRDNQAIKEKTQTGNSVNTRHTLSTMRKSPLNVDVPNLFAKDILRQILQGISFIHQHKICHRDIKPENIFISHDTFKIGDFGSACFPESQESIGTLDYAAPQILLKIPYTQAIDMWSFGCVAYELDVGKPPFYHQDRNQTMRRITNVEFELNQVKDIVLRHLISKLLVLEGESRLTAEQALAHSFFDQMKGSMNKNNQ